MEQHPENQEEITPVEETPAEKNIPENTSAEEIPAEEAEPEASVPFEKPGYVPRPMWQVWAARVGLVLFIILLIAYYMTMFRGGR